MGEELTTFVIIKTHLLMIWEISLMVGVATNGKQRNKMNKLQAITAVIAIILFLSGGMVLAGKEKPAMMCKDVAGNKDEVFVYDITDGNKTLLAHNGAIYRFDDCELKGK